MKLATHSLNLTPNTPYYTLPPIQQQILTSIDFSQSEKINQITIVAWNLPRAHTCAINVPSKTWKPGKAASDGSHIQGVTIISNYQLSNVKCKTT